VTLPTFLTSAADPAGFPSDAGREVAFVGRSNSGKSTALNALLGVRKLARVSKTPGRTQLVNFFAVGPDRRVVDLPGYGFARVPAQIRDRWRGLLERYFRERASLAGLVVTVDIRRGLGELDQAMLDWIAPRGLPVAVLLTKADKLGRGAGLAAQHAAARLLGERARVLRFSALDGSGVTEGRDWLGARLASAGQ
jgi:GTP-binding protein